MPPNKEKATDQATLAVKNITALVETQEIWGLPATLFYLGCLVTVGSYFVFKFWWLPLIVALIYFYPLFLIHREDPRGLTVWLSVLTDPTEAWEAPRKRTTTILFYAKSEDIRRNAH